MRSASDTWDVVSQLVIDTIAVSASVTEKDAEAAMHAAAPVGRMLIAGGHLDRTPVVLIAGAVHCEITTVSGTSALRTEENLNPIPGAATATTFTIYLPTPEPLTGLVATVAATHPRLSAEVPPAPEQQSRVGASLIDTEALRKAMTG